MIGYLWVAVTVTAVAAAVALGLVLLLGRRLRQLREMLDTSGMPLGPDLPEPGRAVPAFDATTTSGGRVTRADLDGPDVVVLFLMESCPACGSVVAGLRERPVREGPSPIAVLVGDGPERDRLVAELEPVARVINLPDGERLAGDFGVHGFPAVLVAGGGVIRSASHRLSSVPRQVPA
ncbi:TlpA family protein disulfide reductase [Nonomuraea sp. NPDC048826]|uniref:TlpA family protein disulfide reductase n=1 Tax=Nonomuraea sp. NPDC048826 TaxID=3364347 RepID=UPI0037230824